MKYDPSNLNQLEEFRNKANRLSDLLDIDAWAFFINLPLCGLRLSDLEHFYAEGLPRNGYSYYVHRASSRVFRHGYHGRPRCKHSLKWEEITRERDWAPIISAGTFV